MSRLLRVVVPSRSICAVRLATPVLPVGSAVPPVPTSSTKSASGNSCCSTIISLSPFASCLVTIGGSDTRGGGPSSGGLLLSIVPCAGSEEPTRQSAPIAESARGFIDYLRLHWLQ